MTYVVPFDRCEPFGFMMSNTFGEWLKAAREKRGLSQRQLALAAGLDPSSISKYEGGDAGAPRRPTLEKIAEALQVDSAYALKAAGFIPSDSSEIEYSPDPDFAPLVERYHGLEAADREVVRETLDAQIRALQRKRSAPGLIGLGSETRYSDEQRAEDDRHVREVTTFEDFMKDD